MRHTPYLDRIGVTFKDTVPDHAVNIIDTALAYIDALIEWGEWDGKKRKPVSREPRSLGGATDRPVPLSGVWDDGDGCDAAPVARGPERPRPTLPARRLRG